MSELDARETSEAVKDAVNHLFKQAILYTNQLANKQKLDELLYSIVTNTVVNRKTNGSLSVLQADIGFSIPGSQIALDDNLPVGMRPLKFYNFEEDGDASTIVIDDHRGKYIRDDETAERYLTWLMSWHMNQHLIIKLKLPLKYMNLEIGDIIKETPHFTW